MNSCNTPITYYSKEMRYPEKHGFQGYLNPIINNLNIHTKEIVVSVDLTKRLVKTNRDVYFYDNLFSSIPLIELGSILTDPDEVFINAVSKLHWTSGYLISLGVCGENPRKDLWDYVYDPDILISRFFSPSNMSEHAAPIGYYSIQTEIYTKDGDPHILEPDDLMNKTIEQLNHIGMINKENVVVKDIKFFKYCNIIFNHETYENREIACNNLRNRGLNPIGRFGE